MANVHDPAVGAPCPVCRHYPAVHTDNGCTAHGCDCKTPWGGADAIGYARDMSREEQYPYWSGGRVRGPGPGRPPADLPEASPKPPGPAGTRCPACGHAMSLHADGVGCSVSNCGCENDSATVVVIQPKPPAPAGTPAIIPPWMADEYRAVLALVRSRDRWRQRTNNDVFGVVRTASFEAGKFSPHDFNVAIVVFELVPAGDRRMLPPQEWKYDSMAAFEKDWVRAEGGPAGTPCPVCTGTRWGCTPGECRAGIVTWENSCFKTTCCLIPCYMPPGHDPPCSHFGPCRFNPEHPDVKRWHVAPTVPVEASVAEAVPFVASRSELGAPITWPTDRYVVRAIIDDKTCGTCARANDVEVLVMAGETPTMHRCEHIDDGSGIMCRCRFERPTPWRLDELARAVAALNVPGTAAIVRELHSIADELRSHRRRQ